MGVIGVRREDKNPWERRVPLTPAAVRRLVDTGIEVVVQPSATRIFADEEYRAAGAPVAEDLDSAALVLAVKEVPVELLRPGTAYAFFSHTIKGQAHNMPLLRAVLDAGATLLDYERVVDRDNRRLIHFGRFAGLAGAVDGLWAWGSRMAALGQGTPFTSLRQAVEYASLGDAFAAVSQAGREISAGGLAVPLVAGVVGYGNVAAGVHEVLDRLPIQDVDPADLHELAGVSRRDVVYRVTFTERDTVRPVGRRTFDLGHYRDRPDEYEGVFAPHLPHLSLLFNAIYWDQRAPRLVRVSDLSRGAGPAVIADLSCDIRGGVEATVRATSPDRPVFVFDPVRRTATDGFAGDGVAILAVDNLPCELPLDASEGFSAALEPWVPRLASANYPQPFEDLDLPDEWRRAVVAHQGTLTPAYGYLRAALDG